MTPRDPRRAMLENTFRGGCVAPRPVPDGEDCGVVYYDSWLPEGWRYNIELANLNFRYGSVSTPLVPTINMYSEDGRCLIAHTTSNAYLDAPQMGVGMPAMGGGLLGGIMGALGAAAGASGDPSMLDPQTYLRKRPLASASQICDEVAAFRASKYGLQIIQVVQESDQPDAIAQAKYQELLKTAPPDMLNSLRSEWHRKLYRATSRDGSEFAVYVEAEVTAVGYNEQQQQQSGGGFFANLVGQVAQSIGSAMQQRTWQTDYEMFMYCPVDKFEQVLGECDRVRESIRLGADFKSQEAWLRQFMQKSAMQTQATVNNAMAQMAADNAAHFDRMSSIIKDTNNYTSNVMHDMMASNAASHDRVANMQSEMIGGYNVYQGTDGNHVRADVAYDHVYQGNVNGQDWVVGVEGGWLEPGVDFVPLGKIEGGNY
ncbi:MAG: hypothetical protein IJ111_04055 [Eggerthellaceae bacterium]|nr:hypothetical protein [Eggerthellaceae bacterium]